VYKAPVLLFAVVCAACASSPANTRTTSPRRVGRDTVQVRDPELERRVARVELRLIEKEAQVEELQTRLDDTRAEVVRTMAKLQTLASRAEAASAMAEADVALQSLRASAAGQQLPEIGQVSKLAQQSNAEFNKQNFGGALYLASLAKAIAETGRGRAAAGNVAAARSGETQFALPLRLKVASRGNVREGPGTSFSVAFSVEAGSVLTGYSYTDEWVRVSDESRRSGWIFRSLVTRP
jgi:uncharacterized coiled-coil protein SlyX